MCPTDRMQRGVGSSEPVGQPGEFPKDRGGVTVQSHPDPCVHRRELGLLGGCWERFSGQSAEAIDKIGVVGGIDKVPAVVFLPPLRKWVPTSYTYRLPVCLFSS